MSPKKLKRSDAAQQLIEDLLDEPSELQMGVTGSFGEVAEEKSNNLVLDGDSEPDGKSLRLEISHAIVLDPVAQAQKTAMLKQPPRLSDTLAPKASSTAKRVSPPPFETTSNKSSDDIDFGQMSNEDDYANSIGQSESSPEEHTMKVAIPEAATLTRHAEPRSEVIPITRNIEKEKSFDRGGATEIRSGVKVPPAPRDAAVASSSVFASAEAALKQSDTLRIAQSRITELERELERVRRDNESLSTAGDTLRRRTDELTSKAETFEIQAREATRMLDEEKKVMRGQLQSKDRDNAEMRARVEEIETRLESNFKKIRVRERELEHRLEIVKMESATLISTKDKMILDLKRQIDQLHHEGDSAKNKSQELFGQYKEKQETIRRVVRALRIALTILEGDDEAVAPVKKSD